MYQKIDIQELAQVGNLEFLANQVVEGFITGLHKSPYHGFSVEFAEHRLYNQGESTRHIDWKLYARTDKMFVKRYEEETNLRCQIVLDVSSSMYFPNEKGKINKAAFSIYTIASLIELLKRQRDAFGLSLFSNKVHFHAEIKSSNVHKKLIYGQLEKYLQPVMQDSKSTKIAPTLHQVAELIHKRSLIVIFSDFMNFGQMNDLLDAIGHMKHNKHEVIVFRVVDSEKEMSLDYDNRIHEFVDMETGERIKLNPANYQESYQKLIEAQEKKIKEKFEEYRVDYNRVDIQDSIDQVLLSFLIKRQKMH